MGSWTTRQARAEKVPVVHFARLKRQQRDLRFDVEWLDTEPFVDFAPEFKARVRHSSDWPPVEAYDELVSVVRGVAASWGGPALTPRFVPFDRDAVREAGGYEAHVARCRAVPTRPKNWHDFFNMAAWAHFPRVRWALNGIHIRAVKAEADPRNGRTPAQNRAAHFDESGMVVVSSDASVLTELQGLQFKRVFWQRRETLARTTRFVLVGHGSMESLLTPHLGLAAKALLVHEPDIGERTDRMHEFVDELAAARIEEWPQRLEPLYPIPMLGIPGWYAKQCEALYDDTRYFPTRRWREHSA